MSLLYKYSSKYCFKVGVADNIGCVTSAIQVILSTLLVSASSGMGHLWWALTHDTKILRLCAHSYIHISLCLISLSFSLFPSRLLTNQPNHVLLWVIYLPQATSFFHTKWMTSSIGRISSMMPFRAPLKVKWWIIFGLHLHTKLNHPWYSPPSPFEWTPYFPSSHRCEMRERHCCNSAGCLLRRYGK